MAKEKNIVDTIETDDVTIEVVQEAKPIDDQFIFDSKESLEYVKEFLMSEFKIAQSEFEEDRTKWKKWRRQLRSKPQSATKNFPFAGASNVEVPVQKIITNTTFGKLVDMFGRRKPFFTATDMQNIGDTDGIKRADVVTKYFNLLCESPYDLNIDESIKDLLLETCHMGLCVAKVPYTQLEMNFYSGGIKRTGYIKNGPEIVVIPRENFIYRKNQKEIQKMPWCCHLIHLNYTELKQRQFLYSNIEKIEESGRDPQSTEYDPLSDNIDGLMGATDKHSMVYDIGEFYCYYDVDGDGYLEDVIITIHLQTGTVLSASYNGIGRRPFVCFKYMNKVYSMDGEGIGDTTEFMQDEVTAFHNMRNDNIKISNSVMFVARRGCGLKSTESFYPGRVIFTDNPQADIQRLPLGEVYPSSLGAEQNTFALAQRASGISEIMSGFADQTLKSRDTFKGQSLRLGQGQGLFGSIAGSIVNSFSDLGMLIFYQLAYNKESVQQKETMANRLKADELSLLMEALNIPLEEIPMKMNFKIKTSDVDQTVEAKRDTLISMAQLYGQYSQQIMPLAQQILSPQAAQMAQQAPDLYQHMASIYVGATKMMRDIFDMFDDTSDSENNLPAIEKQKALLDGVRMGLSAQANQISQKIQGMTNVQSSINMDQNAMALQAAGGYGVESPMGQNINEGVEDGDLQAGGPAF